VGAIVMFFMPESPYYLVTKNRDDEAKKSLIWLRGTDNVKEELEDLKRSHREQLSLGNVTYLDIFSKRIYLEPLAIMTLLMFFQQFSGVNAVLFYLKVIFNTCDH
jgi:hypothetical protein